MSTYITETKFLGEQAYIAGNSQLEILLVPSWGSNLISIKLKKGDHDLLRAPETREEFLKKPILYGTPVLFPPNRISDATFEYNGKTYQLDMSEPERNNHIHGFVYDKPWELIEQEVTEDQVTLITQFDSSKFPDVERQFPHHFLLKMIFTVKGSVVHKDAVVENKGAEPFPWGIGYHTTFNLPIQRGTQLEKTSFSLSAEKQWKLDERLLPTGELEELSYKKELQEGMNLKGWSLDDVYLSNVLEGGLNETVLKDDNLDIKITYRADQNFKHWVIYNGDGEQGFVCPEPYTWVTNAPKLDLPERLTGVQVLNPGESIRVKTEIVVE